MKIAKFIGFIVFLAFIGLSCEKDKGVNEESTVANGMKAVALCEEITVEFIAGQFTDVGEITAVIVGDELLIEYVIDEPGWCMSLTHLDVQLVPGDFPTTKKGNPKVGHFAYSQALDCETSWEVVVDLSLLEDWEAGTKVYIAAHADVVYDPLLAFEDALPTTATLAVYHWGPVSYFRSVITAAGELDGEYVGWCIDVGHYITPGATYAVTIYSSYEDLSGIAADRIDHPENLDQVNWIINQGYVGQTSACGGVYTSADVQRAMWELLDNTPQNIGNMCRVGEILDAAAIAGVGFVPGCGQQIAVILVPDNVLKQVTIIEVAFAEWVDVCEAGEETAWGEGTLFNPNAGWAMYFDYQCVE